jgi:deoxyribodipyrimidine photo-lyase
MYNKPKLVVYWARRDFRLTDNPALFNAVKTSKEIKAEFLPIFILEKYMLNAEPGSQFGYPSRLFLSKAIPEYVSMFKKFLLTQGKVVNTFQVLSETFCLDIHVNEDIFPDFYKQVEKIQKKDISITIHRDMLTVDKNLRSGSERIYSVFTPFKKACWHSFLSKEVLPKVNFDNLTWISDVNMQRIGSSLEVSEKSIWDIFSKNRKLRIGQFELDLDTLLSKPKVYDYPYTNEPECLKRFSSFIKRDMKTYKEDRDSLEKDNGSQMSLGLCWGLVSARTLKSMIQEHFDKDFYKINWLNIDDKDSGPIAYLSELIWREFYKYIFYHNQYLMNEEYQEKFRRNIKWTEKEKALTRFKAWIRGETGYKVVDAAMMQIAKTGWMHNRTRMIVASILTKNLGVDWRWGQEYFRAMLFDLDEASNNGGWQWAASVGSDPKPIRIFNPYLQAEKYDPENTYQNKWLINSKSLDPIVPHIQARRETLKRYKL